METVVFLQNWQNAPYYYNVGDKAILPKHLADALDEMRIAAIVKADGERLRQAVIAKKHRTA